MKLATSPNWFVTFSTSSWSLNWKLAVRSASPLPRLSDLNRPRLSYSYRAATRPLTWSRSTWPFELKTRVVSRPSGVAAFAVHSSGPPAAGAVIVAVYVR